MTFLSRLIVPQAGTPDPTSEFWYVDPSTGWAYVPGSVSAETAMRNSAVYDCVKLVSEDVAKLPLHVYQRRPGGGKDRVPAHPLYSMLHSSPNDWQTSSEFRQLLQAHVELRGNGYARIIPGRSTPVAGLEPIDPDTVKPGFNDKDQLIYTINHKKKPRETLFPEEIFHLRGFSLDGISGLSTIGIQHQAINVGLAAQAFEVASFKNGVRLSGVFQHPLSIGDKARTNLQNSIAENFQGSSKAGGFMILEEGMKWNPISMSMHDAQFLELRKLNRTEIAGIFRVPPHKIGDLDKATFANIEHQALEYVIDGLMARLVRWEQAITRDLIIRKDLFFAEFLVDALLRGDLKSRYDAYKVGIEAGILSPNEVRALENLNPRPGGDRFLMPLNMTTVGATDDRLNRMVRVTSLKLATKELVALRKASAKFEGQDLIDWAEEFYRGYRESLAVSLQMPQEKIELFVNEGFSELRACVRFQDLISTWEVQRAERLTELALAA